MYNIYLSDPSMPPKKVEVSTLEEVELTLAEETLYTTFFCHEGQKVVMVGFREPGEAWTIERREAFFKRTHVISSQEIH